MGESHDAKLPAGKGRAPRDAGNWARPVDRIDAAGAHTVHGRRLTGPIQGFGKMWQKTYRVAIPDRTPEEVIATWKAEYGRFWPPKNRFYAPVTGIHPGEVGLITSSQGPVRLSTGVLVLYADDTSFTYMTPEGHPFAGWITFSAYEEDGDTYGQAQALIRANDPLYELGFAFGASRMEDKMWQHTLRSLAQFLGSEATVETTVVCVDRHRQWSRFGNLRWNAGLRGFGRRRRGAPSE